MVDLAEWTAKQTEIYRKFDADQKTALKEGLKPDPVLVHRRGGYMIALSASTVAHVTVNLLKVLGREIPGIVVYKTSDLHTTFSDLNAADGFDPETDQSLGEVERILTEIGFAAFGGLPKIECRYNRLVFNQTTLILEGWPTAQFFDVANRVVEEGKRRGVSLRLPWGGHVTMARFAEAATPEVAQKLRMLCDTAVFPSGPHKFNSGLKIGWFRAGPKEFRVSMGCPFHD